MAKQKKKTKSIISKVQLKNLFKEHKIRECSVKLFYLSATREYLLSILSIHLVLLQTIDELYDFFIFLNRQTHIRKSIASTAQNSRMPCASTTVGCDWKSADNAIGWKASLESPKKIFACQCQLDATIINNSKEIMWSVAGSLKSPQRKWICTNEAK